MFEESKESNSDWNRAFFARLIAGLSLPPLGYTLLSAVFLEPMPGGAKEHLVIAAGSISLALLLTSFAISHLTYLRQRRTSQRWHFRPIEMIALIIICAIVAFLLLTSAVSLLHPRL
jgi:hypothetical protein